MDAPEFTRCAPKSGDPSVKVQISSTYPNFGRLLKSCDIIFPIEVLTFFPILSFQV